MKTGCKSIVLKKKNGNFVQANIAADKKIDLKKLEKIAGDRLSIATKEEVRQTTDCESGSVLPLGNFFVLPTFLDETVLENDFVNSNNGVLTKSVKISRQDSLKVMKPTIGRFTKSD